MYRYKVQLSLDEIRRSLRLTAYRRIQDHILFWAMLCLPVVAIGADFLASRLWDGNDVHPYLWAAAGGCLGLLFYCGPVRRRISARRMSRSRLVTSQVEFDISPTGILLQEDEFEVRIKWNGFTELLESEEFLLLRINDENSWYILPTRVIPEDELDHLSEFIHDMLSQKD